MDSQTLNPRQLSRLLLKQVEERTGFPVQVIDDPNLTTLASLRMARGDIPAHIITYKPIAGEKPDYIIAYQCGYILRHFANPLHLRFDIRTTPQGRAAVRELVMKAGGPAQRFRLTSLKAEQLQAQLLDGLIIHLRSLPVGMRIGRWLKQDYPVFDELQRAQVMTELAQSRDVQGREFQDIIPEAVSRPTLAMNAAFAQFWAEQYGDSSLQAGYQSGRSHREGQALLRIWQETSPEAEYDGVLVDAWGQFLKLTDWYEWVPYQSPE